MNEQQAQTADVASFDWICHELRKPIAAVKAYGELLEDEISGALNKQQQDHVAAVLRGAARLEDMVHDLFLLGEASLDRTRKESRARLDLEALCIHLQDELAEIGLAVALESDGPLHVDANEGSLREALTRILREVRRAGAPAERVRLVLQRDGDVARLAIEGERVGAVTPAGAAASGTGWLSPPVERDAADARGLGVDGRLARVLLDAAGAQIHALRNPGGGVRTVLTLSVHAD